MTPSTHLYDALNVYLRQCQNLWRDVRHIESICWMMLGIIQSEKVHPSGFGVYVASRAPQAQSKQRRFRRNLSNRRINLSGVHQLLMRQALCQWGERRLYLSLDTTMLWNCFCVVWVGIVYRGRTVPIALRVVPHKSSSIRLWYVQLRIRIKKRFQFQTTDGQWHNISEIKLAKGEAYFTGAVQLGKTKPYGPVYLALAHDQPSGEFWLIVSDEPTNIDTFAEYRLRFQIEENFLDLTSNGFQLEACRIRDPFALTQLLWVVALTMLFLVLQGTAVVAQGL